jgi:hypothetical protein
MKLFLRLASKIKKYTVVKRFIKGSNLLIVYYLTLLITIQTAKLEVFVFAAIKLCQQSKCNWDPNNRTTPKFCQLLEMLTGKTVTRGM